jgi:hypothetical protein
VYIYIYRFCVRCQHPFTLGLEGYDIHKSDHPAFHLLRTCRQICKEGCEVFYGENDFWYWKDIAFVHVSSLLLSGNISWLKELTMSIPFAGRQFTLNRTLLHDTNTILPRDRKVDLRTYRVDLLANRITLDILAAIANAPDLRKVRFIIPPSWELRIEDDLDDLEMNTPDCHGYFPAYINPSNVWQDLEAFFQHQHLFHFTITRLYYMHCQDVDQFEHGRILKRFRNQFGA